MFYVYNRVEGIYERADKLQAARPRGARRRRRTGRWREGGRSSRRCSTSSRALRRPGRDRDHRERARHSARQHDHHRSRRHLRPLAALSAARSRRALARARVLLPDRAAAERDDRRGARAHRGARAPHRARLGLSNRVARSRAARRRRSAGRRADRAASRIGRLRSVLPDARRSGARAARRAGRPRRRPRALVRRRGVLARGLRRRRRRAPLALQATRERDRTRTSRTSPPRWRTASARRPPRRAGSCS